jgi:predicted TIM-barrel fold metal-dependent hydrolase
MENKHASVYSVRVCMSTLIIVKPEKVAWIQYRRNACNEKCEHRLPLTIMLPTITLEEHFVSEALRSSESVSKLALHQHPAKVQVDIIELGENRIRDMDEGGMSLQVISHIPALENLKTCQNANNQLAAFLPMADHSAAANELERSIKDLGFVGTLIPNHAAGTYYDSQAYHSF